MASKNNEVTSEPMDWTVTKSKKRKQTEKLHANQVQNSAGGFVWEIDNLSKLKRFIVLGCEGGTYYSSQQELLVENVKSVHQLISDGRGEEVVEVLKQYSVEGRTSKQDNLIFALAMCARSSNEATKRAAYKSLANVCRIPTHLFTFVEFSQAISKPATGWGRAQRRAVSNWYLQFDKDPTRLAMLLTKYRQRNGWSHKDVLRLSHPKSSNSALNFLFHFAVKGLELAKKKYGEDLKLDYSRILEYVQATEEMRNLCKDNEEYAISLIRQHRLVREHVPTPLLKSSDVMRTLVYDMPLTALIRSLGKLASLDLLERKEPNVHMFDSIVSKLNDEDMLHKAKIHPILVLQAWKIYSSGRGDIGKLSWQPNSIITNALENAFYKSFKNVEPTGKNFFLAVDCSGSMSCSANPIKVISCAEAAAALAMVTLRSESSCKICGFSNKLKDLKINVDDKLETVMQKTRMANFGATDCAAPMQYATRTNLSVDVFVVITDNETYYGKVHPSQALIKYRNKSKIYDSKLVVMSMTSSKFSIADPSDPGMLDVVGFDSNVPQIMHSFVAGEL